MWSRFIAVVPLVAATGCAHSVIPLYEAARADALADPGPAPPDWAPDAWVALSAPTLDQLLVAILAADAQLATTLDAGIARFTPRLEVTDLQILPPEGCDGCLTVDLALRGTLGWETPLGPGSTSLTAEGTFDAVFEVTQEVADFRVDLRPRKLRDVSASLGQNQVGLPVGDIASWLARDLLKAVPPIPITRFDAKGMPVRAVRVVPVGRSIRIEALTKAPISSAVPPSDRVAEGWQVGLSQPTLLSLARASAFRGGPGVRDTVPEPTSLAIGKDRFRLGLRLWRVTGKGWWRDYTVTGRVVAGGGGIDLVPEEVVEGEKSPGALVSDPLAVLGEGRILEAIEEALAITLPARHTAAIGSVTTKLVLTELNPEGDALLASGTLSVVTPDEEKGGRGRRR